MRFGGRQFEEHVHQHRLAASDPAVNIEALDRRAHFTAFAEQPAEGARFRGQAFCRDIADQPVERIGNDALRRIAVNLAEVDEMLVTLHNRGMRLDAFAKMHGSFFGATTPGGSKKLAGERDWHAAFGLAVELLGT